MPVSWKRVRKAGDAAGGSDSKKPRTARQVLDTGSRQQQARAEPEHEGIAASAAPEGPQLLAAAPAEDVTVSWLRETIFEKGRIKTRNGQACAQGGRRRRRL
eukprot:TRINITY_DN1715_c0_g3_i1.p2 TRINITY_DN1715_c0_g3~~TRINITY_DN1715_c0_g3_i1.p2  ORF type:complete len:102 (+),score=12.58 TRINITY_DN1715_c0_g3_i1:158-463(+)